MIKVFLFVVLCLSPHVMGATVGWSVYLSDEGWASISDQQRGGKPLVSAISDIPKNVWIKHFRVFPKHFKSLPKPENLVFHSEIESFLTKHFPKLHSEALGSAGNMHNPKVIALRRAFAEAIMTTSLVKNINTALHDRCERITSASFEKFTITKTDGKPTYGAMIWLSTDKCI